ncbi:right-handed parallel beta-helix repeat-containing protein [Terriglobus roseus]|uniref:Parallel beta-helix repeat (Two copies) n=1 Tax=Terriglobus roseus TaxID=392734 RepID=A0A1G7I1J0_9BACT|nr:right-handed parallel beta-helix repeat-containing protein [Terriglobus roseus]SDF06602.1 parallel beta-helix repeat (two copies) [Terriglobus roseus]
MHLRHPVRFVLRWQWFAWCLILVCAGICSAQDVVYVSPTGKDEWSGKLADTNTAGNDGPLQTLEAARNHVRALRQQKYAGTIHVILRGGTYSLERTFELRPEDSGLSSGPTIYEAYPHEEPVVSGGVRVTDWTETAKNVWQTSPGFATTQLFWDGLRLPRTQTPKNGYLRMVGKTNADTQFQLQYDNDDIPSEWAGTGAEVVLYIAWFEARYPILAVDTVHRIATLAGSAKGSAFESQARYIVENIPGTPEVADTWQQDKKSNVIQLHERPFESLRNAEVIAPRLTYLMDVKGTNGTPGRVHDLRFSGITFAYSRWRMTESGLKSNQAADIAEAAINFRGTDDITVDHCTFHGIGGYALAFLGGNQHAIIDHNHFFDLGAGGIRIGEGVVPKGPEQVSSHHVITNNEIDHDGLVYPSAVGIWVLISGDNVIAHNHLHDLTYSAISVGWSWGYSPVPVANNRIDHNLIHDIGTVLSDLGGIYMLGVQPGTRIDHNLIHHVGCFTYGGWGIYLDEGSTGITVEDNIVYETQSAGFHIHYGRDNVVRNNILAFNRDYAARRTRSEGFHALTFERNIVVLSTGSVLDGVWSDGNVTLDKNLYWNARHAPMQFAANTWEQWQAKGNDSQSVIADPLFRNAAGYDFSLLPGSPALKLGFQAIDLTDVGPLQ